MINQKDLDALKEHVDNIDPIQTKAVVQFIATPGNLDIKTFGEKEEIILVYQAIATAVITATSV